jgi:hypothetical protein
MLQQRQLTAARERAAFEQQMREKAEENSRLTLEAIAMITGGDSHCETLLSSPDAKGRISAMINYEGKYPCYDVVVTLDDLTARGAWMHSELAAGRQSFPERSLVDRFVKSRLAI